MEKRLIIFISFLTQILLSSNAFAQKADTVTIFYKISLDKIYAVDNRDAADFIRVIPPTDPIDKTIHIVDYFPNGKIKMEGKANPEFTSAKEGSFSFIGDCISYFQNGKKESTVSYIKGQKEGVETMYFPDGNIYSTIDHISQGYGIVTKPLYDDCYDLNGKQVCKTGNGEWMIYADDYKHIQEQGAVKNGLKDGEWKGYAKLHPSIKFTSKYKKGIFLSGMGTDSTGKAYSFTDELAPPYYNNQDPLSFVEAFHRHFTIPKENGRRMNMDTIYFSFVVEKDGSVSNVEVLENKNADLKNNVSEALMKTKKWTPTFCYGVPLRTKLMFGYNIAVERQPGLSRKVILYNAEIIGL